MGDEFSSRRVKDPFTLSRVKDLVGELVTDFDVRSMISEDHPVLLDEVSLTLVVQPAGGVSMEGLDEDPAVNTNPLGLVMHHEWGSAMVTISLAEINTSTQLIEGDPIVVVESTADRVADWAEWLLRALKVRDVKTFDQAVES